MPESHRSMVEQSYSSAPAYKEVMAGQPENYRVIKTLGDLLSANYKVVDSREQMRNNLASILGSGRQAFPGIVGYDDDVLPAMCRSILAGHDMLLIGQMGQAKTRLVQTAAETLLSPMPVIRQSLTNDCPMDLPAPELIALLDDTAPERPSPNFFISPESASAIRDNGLDTRISWADGSSRFRYVLATPDISVKDLVGYIDAIKIAKQGTEMYKIESYSPGQLMQAKHGVICIDELPVLDPRKQVVLLSVLQEGRFTTGAYPVVFEPRTVFFATANPVDYTHSGKVIEPLYDRLKSHIHTHYPGTVEDEMMIIMQGGADIAGARPGRRAAHAGAGGSQDARVPADKPGAGGERKAGDSRPGAPGGRGPQVPRAATRRPAGSAPRRHVLPGAGGQNSS